MVDKGNEGRARHAVRWLGGAAAAGVVQWLIAIFFGGFVTAFASLMDNFPLVPRVAFLVCVFGLTASIAWLLLQLLTKERLSAPQAFTQPQPDPARDFEGEAAEKASAADREVRRAISVVMRELEQGKTSIVLAHARGEWDSLGPLSNSRWEEVGDLLAGEPGLESAHRSAGIAYSMFARLDLGWKENDGPLFTPDDREFQLGSTTG